MTGDRYTVKDVRRIAEQLSREVGRPVHLGVHHPGDGQTVYEGWIESNPGDNRPQVTVCATRGSREAFREFQRFLNGFWYGQSAGQGVKDVIPAHTTPPTYHPESKVFLR